MRLTLCIALCAAISAPAVAGGGGGGAGGAGGAASSSSSSSSNDDWDEAAATAFQPGGLCTPGGAGQGRAFGFSLSPTLRLFCKKLMAWQTSIDYQGATERSREIHDSMWAQVQSEERRLEGCRKALKYMLGIGFIPPVRWALCDWWNG